VWLEGIAESKIADFAGEAAAADADVMRKVAPLKRMALLACMVHVARTRARDDLAEAGRRDEAERAQQEAHSLSVDTNHPVTSSNTG
jgi:hypothetical protein